MSEAEFSRPVDVRQADGRQLHLEADESERVALAQRFGLVRIDRLEATLLLARNNGEISAEGTLEADFVQSCAVSAEDLPVAIEETLSFRFVPQESKHAPDEEIEIDAEDCDEIEYCGTSFDLGEAVAQSLALAVDPFATGPEAEEARARLAAQDVSPFAALKGLLPRD